MRDSFHRSGNRMLTQTLLLVLVGFVLLVKSAPYAGDQLPAIVIDEETPASAKSVPPSDPQVTGNAADATIVSGQPVADKAPNFSSSPEKSLEETSKSFEEPKKQQVDEQAASTEEPTRTTMSSVTTKDINVLLASKVDSDNDLAAPTGVDETMSEKRPVMDLDGPVDTIKTSGDERFHYSVGSSVDKEQSPSDKDSSVSSGEKEHSGDVDNKDEATTAIISDTSSSSTTSTTTTTTPPSTMAPTTTESAPKSVTISTTASPPTIMSTETATKLASDLEAKKETKSQPDVVASSAAEPKKNEQPITEDPVVSSAKAGSTNESPTVESSTSKSTVAIVPKLDETSTKSPSISSSTTPQTSAKPEGAVGKQPASVPSILAVALGTALGAAVNPILNKPGTTRSPAIATSSQMSPTRKSSTDKWDKWAPSTGAPSLGSSSPSPSTTTSTASSVGVPHQRRRPIIPSIRRRFRPHNRFNPFPWSVETYGNDPSEFEGVDFGSSTRVPSSSSTSRPRRRHGSTSSTTSTTVEPSSSSKPATRGNKPSSEDSDKSESEKELVSTRRRTEVGHEGRSRDRPSGHRPHRDRPSYHRDHHRDHHHNHHRNRHHHRGDHDHNLGGRRREPSFGWSPGHRHSEYEPELDDTSPFESPSRPFSAGVNPSGFSLFNSANSGLDGVSQASPSGFDLLNPFTSWLDDITKPRPSRPHSPTGPLPVEGVYNDGPVGHRGDHHHGHRDYHDHHDHDHHGHGHDHHHVCHHDHDHDHHGHDHDHDGHDSRRPIYRPPVGRPHGDRDRDREPYRPSDGEHDPYRPHRPRSGSSSPGIASSDSSSPSTPSSGERLSSVSSPSPYPSGDAESGPRMYSARRISSILSPFDSLFGSLHDDLFGGLRSAAFPDTIIKSPKISNESPVPKPDSSRLDSARVTKLN